MSDSLELVDATPPMRHARRTHVAISAVGGLVRLIRDEKIGPDSTHDEHVLGKALWDALVASILAYVALGETRDLVGEKDRNKGVSFNYLELTIGGETARVDYLPSHIDEDDGDPELAALVEAIRRA